MLTSDSIKPSDWMSAYESDAPDLEVEEPEVEDTNEEMSTLYLLDEAEKELAQLMAEPVLKDDVS